MFFCIWRSSFPNAIYWINCPFPIVYSCLLCHNLTLYACVFISGLWKLFHWSMSLFLCQYNAILITILENSLKSGSMLLSALFFFKIALTIRDLFIFPYKFYDCLFYFCGWCSIGILIGNTPNLQIALGITDNLTILNI